MTSSKTSVRSLASTSSNSWLYSAANFEAFISEQIELLNMRRKQKTKNAMSEMPRKVMTSVKLGIKAMKPSVCKISRVLGGSKF